MFLLLFLINITLIIIIIFLKKELKSDLSKQEKESLIEVAKNDYYMSRGYSHLQIINSKFYVLMELLNKKKNELEILNNNLDKLNIEFYRNYKYYLYKYLIKTDLINIEGFGQKLINLILEKVFNGDIKSLLYTSKIVNGVGTKKQLMINLWIQRIINSDINKYEFPEKKDLIENYINKRDDLINKINKLKKEIDDLDEIYKNAIKYKEQFEKIKIKDFLLSLQNKKFDYTLLSNFIKGVFSENEEMPVWFKNLINLVDEERR